ncbi:MAG: acetyl-CoA carboxylase biotin carboxyl carrier protein subunit [Candidatus Neomarinimicrobiota bacterium]
MIFQATVAGQEIRLNLRRHNGRPVVEIAERTPQLDLVRLSPYSYSLLVDGQSHYLSIRPSQDGFMVDLRRRTYYVRLRNELDLTIERLGMTNAARDYSGKVVAPIPGLITSVAVALGDNVTAGDHLLVLEAMKMENEIAAPISGTVTALYIAPGEAVEKGAILLELAGR